MRKFLCFLSAALVAGSLATACASVHPGDLLKDPTAEEWAELSKPASPLTRAEFEERLKTIFDPTGGLAPFLKITDHLVEVFSTPKQEISIATIPFAATSQPDPPKSFAPQPSLLHLGTSPPLAGLKVAIDPADIGGAWGSMEDRSTLYPGFGLIQEGDLNLLVSKVLSKRLKELGADVFVTRENSEPVYKLDIAAVQQVAQAGKMIILRLHALDDAEAMDEAGDAAGGGESQTNLSRNLYKNLEYKLAIFLICAEQYSYLSYYTPAPAKTSEELAPDLPEFKKPLGAPKGPAVRDGFTYKREFQYASVSLDLTKREGHIIWKASYPQAKMLSPQHGEDQIPVGALQCRIEFDRPIQKGTGTISLHRLSDRKKLASILVGSDAVSCPDDKTIVINFSTIMEPKTSYSVTVDKGAFVDVEHMKFLGMPVLGEWKFATR